MQLFINQAGSSISRKNGNFLIQHADGKHHISPLQLQSILVSAGTRISSDAILLAVEHEIDLLFIDHTGHPQARIWSNRFGSISSIRKNQVYFATGSKGADWIIEMLISRIEGMTQTLGQTELPAELTQSYTNTFFSLTQKYLKQKGSPLNDSFKASLRGWEGSASRLYFSLISQHLPAAFQFKGRSRRPAKDLFNAGLNYLYGILYGRIEIAMIKAGLDPYLGVFHRDEFNRPVLVFDMIEGYRHWAEQVMIQLCINNELTKKMIIPKEEGIWMNDAGKAVIVPKMQAYLEEKVTINGQSKSRQNHLQQTCHKLAQEILSYNFEDPF